MKNKYIFGSGISALIFKYYNPEYTIISPDEIIGGAITKHKNILMTFYVHNTIETKQLLDELGVSYKEKRLRIYYCLDNKILDSLDNFQRELFIKNKLSEWDYDSNSTETEDMNLSTQNNYLDILDCDVRELITKLTPKNYITGSIKLVNNNRKFFIYKDKDNKLIKLEYDKIVSTISANLFFPMMYNYKSNYHFNYLPATFVFSKSKPAFMKDESMYYFCNSDIPYNRCQPYNNGYVYETTGLIEEKDIKKYVDKVEIVEDRYVGIIKNERVQDFKHIKFLGRMACWDSSIKVQEVIKKSKEIKCQE